MARCSPAGFFFLLHRRCWCRRGAWTFIGDLDLWASGLPVSCPILAIYIAVDSMVRHASRPNALAFFVVPTFDILAFAPLVFFRLEVSVECGGAQAADPDCHDRDSRRGGCALARKRFVVGAASIGVGDRGFPDTTNCLRSFLDTEDSSRHTVGKSPASLSSACSRAYWAEPRVASVCGLGSACGAVNVWKSVVRSNVKIPALSRKTRQGRGTLES
jgi:hypothetical protein